MDIDAIEQLAKCATPGHLWSADWNVKMKFREGSDGGMVSYALGPVTTSEQAERDANFLEHAVANTLALAARVRELEAEVERMRPWYPTPRLLIKAGLTARKSECEHHFSEFHGHNAATVAFKCIKCGKEREA